MIENIVAGVLFVIIIVEVVLLWRLEREWWIRKHKDSDDG